MQLSQTEGAVDVGDVAKHTAGADRRKLLIITDQSDTPTTTDGELDGGVEREGVGHAGVDDHQGRWADHCRPVEVAVVQGPGEFCESVGADAGLLCEDGGRGSRGPIRSDRRLGSRPW